MQEHKIKGNLYTTETTARKSIYKEKRDSEDIDAKRVRLNNRQENRNQESLEQNKTTLRTQPVI